VRRKQIKGVGRGSVLLSAILSSSTYSIFISPLSLYPSPVEAISSLPVEMRKYMGLLGLGHLRSAPVNCLSMSLTPFCRVPS
jgi:hypothetical protein